MGKAVYPDGRSAPRPLQVMTFGSGRFDATKTPSRCNRGNPDIFREATAMHTKQMPLIAEAPAIVVGLAVAAVGAVASRPSWEPHARFCI